MRLLRRYQCWCKFRVRNERINIIYRLVAVERCPRIRLLLATRSQFCSGGTPISGYIASLSRRRNRHDMALRYLALKTKAYFVFLRMCSIF